MGADQIDGIRHLGRLGSLVQAREAALHAVFLLSQVACELANQSVLVLQSPVGNVVDGCLDLIPGGALESLYAAEIDGVGLDQNRIKLMLADEVAEAVAQPVLAVGAIAIYRLGGRLWWLPLSSEPGCPEKDPISSTEQMPMP